MYLSCDDIINNVCTYNITNTTFLNNTANLNGGAYAFDFYKPNTTDVVFGNGTESNKAEYGDDYASYAINM